MVILACWLGGIVLYSVAGVGFGLGFGLLVYFGFVLWLFIWWF